MKILVIPDVHLKPHMFHRASELLKENIADRAVCLMDIADDWHQQFNVDLYMQTYDAAIAFALEFPDTLWCYGNHDVSYLWSKSESGYSVLASWTVCKKLRNLRESLPDESRLAYVHRIDNVLFSHAGLADEFVRKISRRANIITSTQSSRRSTDSAAGKCGRICPRSGTVR